jgi:hypothetical protein
LTGLSGWKAVFSALIFGLLISFALILSAADMPVSLLQE